MTCLRRMGRSGIAKFAVILDFVLQKTKSIVNWLYLKKKLFCFQFKHDTSMHERLNSFNKNLNVEIDDEDRPLLSLNFLPNAY